MARRGDTKSSAVMSRRRKKDDNEGLTEEERRWKTLDLYGTPPWAARAGAEIAARLFPTAISFLEPAAGALSLAGPWAEHFGAVACSDIYAHAPGVEVRDFFDDALWPQEPVCDVIFTNPPFVTAAEFLRRALPRARLGVAFLVRTVWVESEDRYSLFTGEHPCTQIAFFSERVPMQLGPWDPECESTATSYSWMFWVKGAEPMAPLWIAPGTRDRLRRKDDGARYGRLHPLPLFPEPVGDVV